MWLFVFESNRREVGYYPIVKLCHRRQTHYRSLHFEFDRFKHADL